MYENLVLDQNNLYLISFNILIICLLFNVSMDILGRNYFNFYYFWELQFNNYLLD